MKSGVLLIHQASSFFHLKLQFHCWCTYTYNLSNWALEAERSGIQGHSQLGTQQVRSQPILYEALSQISKQENKLYYHLVFLASLTVMTSEARTHWVCYKKKMCRGPDASLQTGPSFLKAIELCGCSLTLYIEYRASALSRYIATSPIFLQKISSTKMKEN